MLVRAGTFLEDGLSFVMDATFLASNHLQAVADLSRRYSALPVIVECHCPEGVALKRVRSRERSRTALSDAAVAVYHQQKQQLEPAPLDVPLCRIDTNSGLASILDRVLQHLRQVG
jgi:predicted kinase